MGRKKEVLAWPVQEYGYLVFFPNDAVAHAKTLLEVGHLGCAYWKRTLEKKESKQKGR